MNTPVVMLLPGLLCDAAVWAAQQRALSVTALLARPDARPVFNGTRCPALLMCGREDAWSPLARHQQMQALLPAARLTVIEDSGHMTTMEQPQAVSEALAQWLGITAP